MKILVNSTAALWQQIIHEAEAACDTLLNEELESYLVFLMMRYTSKPEFAKQILAPDFLKGLKLLPQQRKVILQDVGDKCLLFSGLFPKRSEKRLIKVSYFVNLGQSSYATISETHNDLYGLLAVEFVNLMDVLQSLRQYTDQNPNLLPLQAYDLWNETGSKRALSVLKLYSKGIPIRSDQR